MSNHSPRRLRFSTLLPEDGGGPFAAQILATLREVEQLKPSGPGEPPDFLLNLTAAPAPPLSPWPPLGVWSLHLDPPGRFLRSASLRQSTPTGTQVLDHLILPAALTDAAALSLLTDAFTRTCRLHLAGLPLSARPSSFSDLHPPGLQTRLANQFRHTMLTEIWQVGLVHAPIARFLDPDFRPQVQWLSNANPSHFYADPFLALEGDQLRILVEEYDYRTDPVGRIGELLYRNGRFHPPARRILPAASHMSYPFLFSSQGMLYCIPETWEQNRIRLHRFHPDRETWDEGRTLIDGIAAVDSTLLHHDGRWWLFCTEKGPGVDCRLLLWHALHLDGPWLPHPANPVKVDVRSGRPGGTPFISAGHLYRPAQDCSESYGCRLSLNRIGKLSPTEFEEEVVRVLEPFPDWPCREGWHTLSGAGEWTILDAKRMSFLPALAAGRIRHKFRRLAHQMFRGAG